MPFLTCVKRSSPRRRRDPKDLCFRLTAAAAAWVTDSFQSVEFHFPSNPPPNILGCVCFTTKLYNRNQKTEKPVTRIRYYIAHNGPRYSKNPPIFMSPTPRPVEAVASRPIYYNAYYNAHNAIIHLYDIIRYVQTCRSAIGFVMMILEAAADEHLHFRR